LLIRSLLSVQWLTFLVCSYRFDNLFPAQVATLLDTVLPSTPEGDAESMEKVASCIAHTAHKTAKSTRNRTPFAIAAQKAGYEYLGGKMDDITVIASLVTPNI
jgi:protein phosphatase PTC7